MFLKNALLAHVCYLCSWKTHFLHTFAIYVPEKRTSCTHLLLMFLKTALLAHICYLCSCKPHFLHTFAIYVPEKRTSCTHLLFMFLKTALPAHTCYLCSWKQLFLHTFAIYVPENSSSCTHLLSMFLKTALLANIGYFKGGNTYTNMDCFSRSMTLLTCSLSCLISSSYMLICSCCWDTRFSLKRKVFDLVWFWRYLTRGLIWHF